MTEPEWLDISDPQAMLACLGERADDRLRRLFACACCRRIWHLLTDERSQRAVEVAERFANGSASSEDLAAARENASRAQAEAKSAEWYAEAEANFCYTADYCAVCARLYAACAARAAVSLMAAEPDGGQGCYQLVDPELKEVHFGKRREGSHYWAAEAAAAAARSAASAACGASEPGLYQREESAERAVRAAVQMEQVAMLRHLVGNSFCQEPRKR